jgi:hypothetical protein
MRRHAARAALLAAPQGAPVASSLEGEGGAATSRWSGRRSRPPVSRWRHRADDAAHSSRLTRTIAAVSSDTPGVSLPDLVGTTMAPREVLHILATVEGGVPGWLYATLRVSFDTGPGSSTLLSGRVAAADFAIEMADCRPTDGWLALGAVDLDAAPSTVPSFSATSRRSRCRSRHAPTPRTASSWSGVVRRPSRPAAASS